MYLLSVLSSDRTAEITFLLSLNSSYAQIPSGLPSRVVSNIHQTALAHHTRRFYNPTYAGLITSLTADPGRDPGVAASVSTSTSSGSGSGSGVGVGGKQQGQGQQNQNHSQQHQHQKQPQPQQVHSQSQQLQPAQQQQSQSQQQQPQQQSQPQQQQQQSQDQTLRSQYGRFLPPPPTSPPTRHAYLTTLEEVLGKYYNESRTRTRPAAAAAAEGDAVRPNDYQTTDGLEGTEGKGESRESVLPMWHEEGSEKNWVYLATPFVCCYARPVAVFLAFQKMMDRMSGSSSSSSLPLGSHGRDILINRW